MDVTPDHRDMSGPAEYNINRDMFKRKLPQDSKDTVKKRLFMTGKTEPYQWTYEQPVEDCLIIDEKQTEEKTLDMNEPAGEKNMEVQDDRYVTINTSSIRILCKLCKIR